MGWTTSAAGGMWGDQPADEAGVGVEGALHALGPDATAEGVVAALAAALRHDGRHEPLTSARHRLEAIELTLDGKTTRVGPCPPSRAVVEMFDALDTMAIAFVDALHRPPSMVESVDHFVAPLTVRLEERDQRRYEIRLRPVLGKDPKPRDRVPRPEVPSDAPRKRVRHPKFGDGTIVAERGDNVVVALDAGGERTILRRFLTPLG